MDERTALLHARGVAFSYGAKPVLHAIDLRLHPGQVLVILGPNGSGKTTLIKLLAGLLRGQGSIAWENKDLPRWTRRQLARRIAYLPQSPTWEPGQTVADVLRLGRAPYWRVMGLESEIDAQVVAEIAESLALTDLLRTPIDRLSGGQRQRVFIGRCLVQQPAALLLDEPNTFLDLRHQVDLGRLIRKLAKTQSVGVVMALHDLNLAAAFADRMLVLAEGKVVKEGTPTEVMDPAMLERVYGVAMERVERNGVVGVLPVVE